MVPPGLYCLRGNNTDAVDCRFLSSVAIFPISGRGHRLSFRTVSVAVHPRVYQPCKARASGCVDGALPLLPADRPRARTRGLGTVPSCGTKTPPASDPGMDSLSDTGCRG